MNKLSKRLEVVASFVNDKSKVLDIGCDHGLVSIYLVNNYTPNAKRELERLDYRMVWEDEIRKYLLELNKKKPVIMCGDLNVAHDEIDLKNPNSNIGYAGF